MVHMLALNSYIKSLQFSLKYLIAIVLSLVVQYVYSQGDLFVVEDSISGFKGCMDYLGKLVIPYEYEELELLENEKYLVAAKNSKTGLLDCNGNICVPFTYGWDAFISDEDEVFFVEKNGKYGLVDFNNKQLIPFQYDAWIDSKDNLLVVKKGNRYGIIDLKKKKEILPCIYERIEMGNKLYDNGWHVIYNKKYSNLTAILKNGKWGFVDLEGNIVIPCQYENTLEIDENGLVDIQNHPARHYYFFIDGKTPFMKNKKVGLLDEKGNIIVAPIYKDISITASNEGEPFGYSIAEKDNGKKIIIDKDNKIISKDYEDIDVLDSIYAKYKFNNRYGVFNLLTKKEITSAIYENIDDSHEGYIRCKKNGKYGYVDSNGKEITDFIYDDGYGFYNGYCAVKKDGKWGFLKEHGHSSIYINHKYDKVSSFTENGYAKVCKDGKYGIISTKDRLVLAMDYDNIYYADNYKKSKLWLVERNKLYGLIDERGLIVAPCEYTKDLIKIEERNYIAKKSLESEGKNEFYNSEEMFVNSMTLSQTDLSASISNNMKYDANGTPCALVRVLIKDTDVVFEGNIVGKPARLGMQYLVYMGEGCKFLRIIPSKNLPIMVSFSEYGYKSLKGKSTYDLIITSKKQ